MIVHPAVIGGSVPFFASRAQEGQLDVVEVEPFEGGALALGYRPVMS